MVPYAVNPVFTGRSCSLKGCKGHSLSVVPLCCRKHHVSCYAFFECFVWNWICVWIWILPEGKGCFVSQVFLVSFALPQSLLHPAADDDDAATPPSRCYHIGIAARLAAMRPHWQAMRHRTATCLLCCMLYKPKHSNSQHGPSCSSKASQIQPFPLKCFISVSSTISSLF